MNRLELIEHLQEIGTAMDAERNGCRESREKQDMDVMYLHVLNMYHYMCDFQEKVYEYLLEEVHKELCEL